VRLRRFQEASRVALDVLLQLAEHARTATPTRLIETVIRPRRALHPQTAHRKNTQEGAPHPPQVGRDLHTWLEHTEGKHTGGAYRRGAHRRGTQEGEPTTGGRRGAALVTMADKQRANS